MSDPRALNAAREHLVAHGLPGTLLPDTIAAFTLDEGTGRFEVTLSKKTKVALDAGYTILYAPSLSGTLAQDAITGLKGVKVKFGLLKPAITAITADAAHTTLTFAVAGQTRDVPYNAFVA